MNAINLRAASLHDKSVLLEFEQKVVEAERPFNSSIRLADAVYYDLENLIASDKSYLLLAEIDGKVVGSGYSKIQLSKPAFSHEAHAYLGFMYVKPECRGQGVIQLVLDELIQWSKDQGVLDCYLDVYSENAGAVRAYEKTGFVNLMTEMKLSLK